MKQLDLQIGDAVSYASEKNMAAIRSEAAEAIGMLESGKGKGSDFLGWMNLPESISVTMLDSIAATAERLRKTCEYVVVIGIGGSYLGAKAVISALSDSFSEYKAPAEEESKVIFAGQNISEDYIADLCRLLEGRRFGIIVISKSGTTTEPAIAFRILREQLEHQAGKNAAKELIVAVTDAEKGALRTLADREKYETYVIPDNVGGRFSVLTPVGLLPVAVAGFDIKRLMEGAAHMAEMTRQPSAENPAETYACLRNALYRGGKKIELLVNFNPRLHYFSEWWKQLFGESEGKEEKGIFPASVDFTTDLHSMGQWIQQGERSIFETVISVAEPSREKRIPCDDADIDGINFMAGKRIDEVNKMAETGTRLAHVDGGVPVIRIVVPALDEETMGALIYFFEKACGISGYILDVNPFDQPGVEAYKKNMFALLGKPGYEKETEAIRARLK